jgi:uncharacterized membrane protein HdeD (DUF308 family)
MTTAIDARGVEDLPTWVRRSWLVPLLLGILLVVIGLVLLFNIGAGIRTLRWLVVIDLVLAAAYAFATASLRRRTWVGVVIGALYVIAAVIGVVWPAITLFVLVITVGVALLVAGIAQAVTAWQVRRTARGWGWSFALGVLSVVAGLIFLFANPVISLGALAIILACHILLAGFTTLVMAFTIKRATGYASAAFSH